MSTKVGLASDHFTIFSLRTNRHTRHPMKTTTLFAVLCCSMVVTPFSVAQMPAVQTVDVPEPPVFPSIGFNAELPVVAPPQPVVEQPPALRSADVEPQALLSPPSVDAATSPDFVSAHAEDMSTSGSNAVVTAEPDAGFTSPPAQTTAPTPSLSVGSSSGSSLDSDSGSGSGDDDSVTNPSENVLPSSSGRRNDATAIGSAITAALVLLLAL